MDWIRRNFPDLLIGLALVVVIGAIIATLLSGGSFLPFGSGQGNAATITGPRVTAPMAPSTTSPDQAANPVATIDSSGITTSPDATATIPLGPDATNNNNSNSGINVEVPPVVPLATEVIGNAAGDATSAVSGAATAAGEAAADAANAVASVANNVGTNAVNAVTSIGSSGRPSVSENMAAPYRISVGAFGNPANAQKRLETFKAKGFPAFRAKQGSLNLVLVGPYETEAEAIKVANEIKSSGLEPGATVIKFNPNASSSRPTQSRTQNTSAPVARQSSAVSSVSSAGSQAAAPPTSAAGKYLQVGAYNNSKSAQPLRERLAKLGFETYELQDGNLIKILVGPYDDANTARAQTILKSNGFDSFVR